MPKIQYGLDRTEAIENLIKLGAFIPVKDMELYHGRASEKNENWQVDPNFNNAGDKTHNHNINKMPALNTGSLETAREFAEARTIKLNNYSPNGPYEASVEKIESYDKSAVIFDMDFSEKNLTPEEKSLFKRSLGVLSQFNVTEYSPIKFKDKEKALLVNKALKSAQKEVFPELRDKEVNLFDQKTEELAMQRLKDSGQIVDKSLITQIAGAFNTRTLIRIRPSDFFGCYRDGQREIPVNFSDGTHNFNINFDVIASYMAKNHIIGIRQPVTSATLWKDIDNYLLFSLSEVNVRSIVGNKMLQTISTYASLAHTIGELGIPHMTSAFLSTNSPRDIMKDIPTPDYFLKNSGVWEGYTVGQHTETVLRCYENSFSANIPENINQIMRLAIIIHDIDKGISLEDKSISTAEHFKNATEDLFRQLEIPKEIQDIACFIAKDSQKFTTDYYVNKNLNAKDELKDKSLEVLKTTLNVDPNPNSVDGLVGMCEMMQACDSGAYTPYATIRGIEGDEKGLFFTGGNENFAQTFEDPTNLTHNNLVLKDPVDATPEE